MKKKLCAILVALVIFVSAFPGTYAIADNSNALTVNGDNNSIIIVQDVANSHWASVPIGSYVAGGVINGTSDVINTSTGAREITFAPDDPFTRGALAKVAALAAGIEPYEGASKLTFSDVTADNWAYPYVEALAEVLPSFSAFGGNGTYRPAANATREDVFVLSANALGIGDGISDAEATKTLSKFADADKVSPQVKPQLAALVDMGVITGSAEGGALYLKPQSNLTRAEAVTVIYRTFYGRGEITWKNAVVPEKVVTPTFTITGETEVDVRAFFDGIEATYTDTENFRKVTSQPITTNFSLERQGIKVRLEKGTRKLEFVLLVSPDDSGLPGIAITAYSDSTDEDVTLVMGQVTGNVAVTSLAVTKTGGATEQIIPASDGSFIYNAPLTSGNNVFTFKAGYSLAGKQESVSTSITINKRGKTVDGEQIAGQPYIEYMTAAPPSTSKSSINVVGIAYNTSLLAISNAEFSDWLDFDPSSGKFSLTWPLQPGANSLTLRARGNDPEQTTKDFVLTTNCTVAPSIEFDSSVPPIVNTDTLTITGRAYNISELVDKGGSQLVSFNKDTGRFTLTWKLKPGVNTLTLKGIGSDDNHTTVEREITTEYALAAVEIKLISEPETTTTSDTYVLYGNVTNPSGVQSLYAGSDRVNFNPSTGEFSYTWKLKSGSNTLKFVARDKNNTDVSKTVTTTYSVPPVITVTTALPPETKADSVTLSVKFENTQRAYIGGKEVTLDAQGYVRDYVWTLPSQGDNTLAIEANSATNVKAERTLKVYKDSGFPEITFIGSNTTIPKTTPLEKLIIVGRIRNHSLVEKLLINNVETAFDSQGYFTYTWNLNMGLNKVHMTLTGTTNFNAQEIDLETTRVASAALPDGEISYYQNHTYILVDQSLTWLEAKAAAEAAGGHLATISDEAEQNFIVDQYIRNGTKDWYWIGATDELVTGQWKWITGEAWNYSAWYPNCPANTKNSHYVALHRNCVRGFRWHDGPNDGSYMEMASSSLSRFGYIIEIEAIVGK